MGEVQSTNSPASLQMSREEQTKPQNWKAFEMDYFREMWMMEHRFGSLSRGMHLFPSKTGNKAQEKLLCDSLQLLRKLSSVSISKDVLGETSVLFCSDDLNDGNRDCLLNLQGSLSWEELRRTSSGVTDNRDRSEKESVGKGCKFYKSSMKYCI